MPVAHLLLLHTGETGPRKANQTRGATTVRDMNTGESASELRRAVLSVIVTHDIDITPHDRGVVLAGGTLLAWDQLAQVCGSRAPMSPAARHRIAALLRIHDHLARLDHPSTRVQQGRTARDVLRESAEIMALPRGHVHHLGPAWQHREVAGRALSLGLGLRTTEDRPPLPVPHSLLQRYGLSAEDCWPRATVHLERHATVAAELLTRGGRYAGTLRPVAGSDVLTLLAGSGLRRALAAGDGSGMRAVAVPARAQGWYDLTRVDPAYVALAWQLTDEVDRGVRVPLLVTADEVVSASIRGDLTRPAVETR